VKAQQGGSQCPSTRTFHFSYLHTSISVEFGRALNEKKLAYEFYFGSSRLSISGTFSRLFNDADTIEDI
jgi:hypothetical protein